MAPGDIRIGITEFRQNLRDFITEAESGSRIVLTRGSKDVAVLLPAEIFACGHSMQPNGGGYRLPKIDRIKVGTGPTASELLRELRDSDLE